MDREEEQDGRGGKRVVRQGSESRPERAGEMGRTGVCQDATRAERERERKRERAGETETEREGERVCEREREREREHVAAAHSLLLRYF